MRQAKARKRLLHIAAQSGNPAGQIVQRQIFQRQIKRIRRLFNTDQLSVRIALCDLKQGGAGTASGLHAPLAGLNHDRSGQKGGVQTRAVAVTRLTQSNPPPQNEVFRDLRRSLVLEHPQP